MRAYSYIKKKNKIFIFRKIKGEINSINLCFNSFIFKYLKFFYPDIGKINFDLAITQYTFQKFSFRKFNLQALLFLFKEKKIIFPIPFEYFSILESNNIKLSKFFCNFLWILKSFVFWLYGNYMICKIVFLSLKNLFIKYEKSDLHFFNIKKENLPFKQSYSQRRSYDLLSWFIEYFKKNNYRMSNVSHNNKNIPEFCHENLKIFFINDPYFFIKNFICILKFIIVSILTSFLSLFFLFSGKWESSFILNEVIKLIATVNISKKKIPKNYLFHFSETFYRPLWTYLDTKLNIKIFLYFYSTYDSPIDAKNYSIDRKYEFGNISWNPILVWDFHQKKILEKYIHRSVPKDNVIITGPIWFRDKEFVLQENNKIPKVLIFDMEVQRPSIHFGWGEIAEYNNHDRLLNVKFLEDIIKVFENDEVCFLLKRKRKIGNASTKKYQKLLIELRKKKHFFEIDEDVSPQYLIDNSNYVISTPFTSTNFYKIDNKIKVIFYDPINYVLKSDPAARNITIIKGFNELQNWKKMNYEH